MKRRKHYIGALRLKYGERRGLYYTCTSVSRKYYTLLDNRDQYLYVRIDKYNQEVRLYCFLFINAEPASEPAKKKKRKEIGPEI